MHSKLRAFLEKAPIKLIAVILFAVLIPSLLVTGLGLVAVFQADAFVQDRFQRPLRGKVEVLRSRLAAEWARRLGLYATYFRDAPQRPQYLRELCGRDSFISDVFVTTPRGLDRAPELPPLQLWSRETSAKLAALDRLEIVEGRYEDALAECRRILATSPEDPVLVEVQLAAARISYRLGQKEGALAYLRSALDRFGNTVDSSGIVREIPILWRILEIERELNLQPRAQETASRLAGSMRQHRQHMDTEVLNFFEKQLSSLGDPYRPALPLDSGAWRPLLTESGLEVLARSLPRDASRFTEGAFVETHVYAEGPRDLVSLRTEEEGFLVHLLLDRDRLIAEAQLEAEILDLSPAGLRFSGYGEPAVGTAPTGASVLSLTMPSPLSNLRVDYFPAAGEVPRGFRGFNVLSLATFTWAVIVLVLSILVGVLFTLRSVLREMRTARMKSDFVSFVSHELKTPLTAIRMFTETILAGRVEDEEERAFCVQMIDQESERLSKLIEQILEYSKIERHQKEFRFESCDMAVVVREAVRLFQDHNRLEPREIEINTAQSISKIKMDRAAMIELFLNLLSNAAKYSSRDKKIVINIRESIDDISVEVIDHGVGIRKRDQKKIFERFYRADDYLTREVEGTGLGLTFARYIAKVHNGDIRVSSQVNVGSVFTLQIRKTHVLAG